MVEDAGASGRSAYRIFSRQEWSGLRSGTALSLSELDLGRLRGLTDRLSLDEVTEIFLPLSRLLHLQVSAARALSVVQDTFVGQAGRTPPTIIGIAGSVAVGKSTFARVLQAILRSWPGAPSVELVTTDGFLYPTRVLAERGLLQRKGFPESYDLRRMIAFLAAVRAGEAAVGAPVYSHTTYDLVPDQEQVVRRPDILIFEGLNVLQTAAGPSLLASDFFDVSIYLDADEPDIEAWYVERFLMLQRTAFQTPDSYFHRYRDLPEAEAIEFAKKVWAEINLVNLRQNIQPTRERARIVLRKRADHRIDEIRLRRM